MDAETLHSSVAARISWFHYQAASLAWEWEYTLTWEGAVVPIHPTPLVYRPRLRPWKGKRSEWDAWFLNKDKFPNYHFLEQGLGWECRPEIWPSVDERPWLYLLCWAHRTGEQVFWSTTVNTYFFKGYFDKWFMLPKPNCVAWFFFLFNLFLVHLVSYVLFYSFFLFLICFFFYWILCIYPFI